MERKRRRKSGSILRFHCYFALSLPLLFGVFRSNVFFYVAPFFFFSKDGWSFGGQIVIHFFFFSQIFKFRSKFSPTQKWHHHHTKMFCSLIRSFRLSHSVSLVLLSSENETSHSCCAHYIENSFGAHIQNKLSALVWELTENSIAVFLNLAISLASSFQTL